MEKLDTSTLFSVGYDAESDTTVLSVNCTNLQLTDELVNKLIRLLEAAIDKPRLIS
jgi:hypothetical protein